ncbi:MAG TPA: adenylate kinase [Saprospirales bacterium]|nr:adenylate kinase [Saprospirales bacterium]HAY70642.1 adenylate kinase [Saprospirales bacterium]HRQ28542.1 adenylate kinase [Saprospiraceae bacterium]
MINLILFGPPGSGKGTQAQLLEEKYNLHHISTGDLFRYELTNNTELGQQARVFMDKGQLVPDAITIGMLKNKLLSLGDDKGFLLDGFPRNLIQAISLDDLMKEMNMEITALVCLNVTEEEIVARILNRGKTSGRSDDNDESIIRNRYQVYLDQTRPVFTYYEAKNRAAMIEGLGSIEEIFGRLCAYIDSLK